MRPHQPGAKRRDRRCLLLGLGLLLTLGGCSDVPDQANPVSWWHDLEGGEIAQNRPPPPNPDAPFPKIAHQPARPAGMPDWEWTKLSTALATQRTAAQSYAAQNPIPTLPQAPTQASAPLPTTMPKPQAPPATTPAESADSAATAAEIARLAAAPGPAGSQTPPPSASAVGTATANAGNTTTSALTFQGPSPPPQAAATAGPARVPIPDSAGTKTSYFDPGNGLSIPGALSPVEQPDEAHPPPVPATVPMPPAVPGFAIQAIPSTYAQPLPLPEPAPYVPPGPLPAVGPVPIQFAQHSAVLTPPMQRALLKLIQAGHGARLAVTGFGDATSQAIGDQAAAMPLALERARAMVVQLMADGASEKKISAGASALGQGGLARLVD